MMHTVDQPVIAYLTDGLPLIATEVNDANELLYVFIDNGEIKIEPAALHSIDKSTIVLRTEGERTTHTSQEGTVNQ